MLQVRFNFSNPLSKNNLIPIKEEDLKDNQSTSKKKKKKKKKKRSY